MTKRNIRRFCRMHLYNRKMYFIMSVLIMLVGMIMVFKVMCVYYSSNYNLLQIKRLFGGSMDGMYKIEQGYLAMDYNYYEHYRDILMELEEKGYDIAVFEKTNIFPRDISDKIIPVVLDNFTGLEMMECGGCPFLLRSDNRLLEAAGIRDEEGNILNLCVDDEGRMQVAVGALYRDVVNIGDVFKDRSAEQEYIVTCFLAAGQQWFSGQADDTSVMVSLDKYFISPIDLASYSDFGCMTFANNVYLFCDGGDTKQVNEILEYGKEKTVYFDIISFEDYIKELKQNNRNYYIFNYILAVIMFVTVLTVVVVVSLITWMADSRDIGILFAGGFGRRDMLRIILYENNKKMTWPFLVTAAYMFMKRHSVSINIRYMIEIYFIIVIVFLAAMLLCSVFSYRYICRRTPEELLRGETD